MCVYLVFTITCMWVSDHYTRKKDLLKYCLFLFPIINAGYCHWFHTICWESTQFLASFLDVRLLLFRVCRFVSISIVSIIFASVWFWLWRCSFCRYKWNLSGVTLDRRLDFFESNWAFFAGFGRNFLLLYLVISVFCFDDCGKIDDFDTHTKTLREGISSHANCWSTWLYVHLFVSYLKIILGLEWQYTLSLTHSHTHTHLSRRYI